MTAWQGLQLRIAEKLRSAAPIEHQRLAEMFARASDPERYATLVPHGRNTEAQPTKGWPDAFVPGGPDGRVDAVEGTRDRASWQKHVEEDYKKACSPRNCDLSGYLHVNSYPDHRLDPTEMSRWKARFAALGISRERIDIVVGEDLVERLSNPRFARVRHEILGLPYLPNHFGLVTREGEPDGSKAAFRPSADDYAGKRVFEPAELADVKSALEEYGCAYVRGIGAAGKTTLGRLIALAEPYDALPAYYLDVSNGAFDDAGGAAFANAVVNDMLEFGGAGVLFVVDNVHQTRDLARDISLRWRDIPDPLRPRVLFLGRRLGRNDIADDGASFPVVDLYARHSAVQGVFRRLACRRPGDGVPPPVPPQKAVEHWVRTFGGDPAKPTTSVDLICFSAAVNLRLGVLLDGNGPDHWQLREEDAVEEVRAQYLRPLLGKPEFDNLIRLACVPEGLSLPVEALPTSGRIAGFVHSMDTGLVFRTQHGTNQWVRYGLAHDALCRLILKAVDMDLDAVQDRRKEMARNVPFLGWTMVRHLRATGDVEEAKGLADAMMAPEGRAKLVKAALSLPASYLASYLRFVGSEDPAALERLAEDLTTDRSLEKLAQTVLATQLHFLVSFLGYAKTNLPEVHAYLGTALTAEESLKTLAARVLESNLGDAASFLGFAKSNLPEVHAYLGTILTSEESLKALGARVLESNPGDVASFLGFAKTNLPGVHAYLGTTLTSEESLKVLAARVLGSNLGDVASFLGFAKTNIPAVHSHLTTALATKDAVEALARAALATPPHFLASFLGYAKTNLPEVHAYLKTTLATEESSKALAARVLESNLGDVISFLGYAKTNLPAVHSHVRTALATRDAMETLARTAPTTPPDHLGSFLDYAKDNLPAVHDHLTDVLATKQSLEALARTVVDADLSSVVGLLARAPFAGECVAAIDEDEWTHAQLDAPPRQPNFVVNLAKVFARWGRPVLTEAPARNLIRKSGPTEWNASGVTIHHLATVLHHGAEAEEASVPAFLDRAVTVDWLDRNYQDASPGSLGRDLLVIALYLAPDQRRRFITSGLRARMPREIPPSSGESELGAQVLSLLGGAAAIGLETFPDPRDWPGPVALKNVLEGRPLPERANFKWTVFWLGVRVLAALRPGALAVAPGDGDCVLALWRECEAATERVDAFNRMMIDWLEACAAGDWTLVSPTDGPGMSIP